MMHYSRWLSWVLAALVLTSVLSCGEVGKPPLRLASSPWPGYEPLYLARDLGYLEPSKVALFELPSSDINLESFRNHSTDLSTLTLDEAFSLLKDGVKLKIILVLDISHGGDAVLANPDIKTLADLKDKRISIVNIPLGLYMLNRLLDFAGLEREDVQVFPMPESKQEKFYLDGKADVVITFEPVKTRLLNAGANLIFDSSQIPNEIFDLMLVHEDTYNERKAELCDAVGQWFRVLRYIESNREDAGQRITRRLGLEASEFGGMMDGIILGGVAENKKLLGGDNPLLYASAEKMMETLLEAGVLEKPVDYRTAVDSEFAHCYQ